MTGFKFHLVTVIGIFLSLSLGIIIGSATSDEIIIRQQREVIQSLESKNSSLSEEQRALSSELEEIGQSVILVGQLVEQLTVWYMQTNPDIPRVLLVYDGRDFSPDELGSYMLENVVQTQVLLNDCQPDMAVALGQAVVEGKYDYLESLGDWLTAQGNWQRPDLVLLAIQPVDGLLNEAVAQFGTYLLDSDIPVVAVGKRAWGPLAEIFDHPLYASVSHLDTPLGMYCLAEILLGQSGHFGYDCSQLPWGDTR